MGDKYLKTAALRNGAEKLPKRADGTFFRSNFEGINFDFFLHIFIKYSIDFLFSLRQKSPEIDPYFSASKISDRAFFINYNKKKKMNFGCPQKWSGKITQGGGW